MSTQWEPVPRFYDPLKAGSIDGTDTVPHDHGIVRALEAEYKPNKLVEGDPRATIFVGRLNPETTEETLKKVFSEYGDIKNMRLVRDIVTGFSKRYAFIEFHDRYDAVKAQRGTNKIVVDDRELFVDGECERLLPGWIPRRLGGGFSGKKESGQLRFGGKDRPFKKPIHLFKVGPKVEVKKHNVAWDRKDSRSSREGYHTRERFEHKRYRDRSDDRRH